MYIYVFLVVIGLTLVACDEDPIVINPVNNDLINIPFNPVSVTLDIPFHLGKMVIPEDNPLTKDGIELGRYLFYDPILSGDSTLSCAGCHKIEHGFADLTATSMGITGQNGKRNSMSLINVGFSNTGLFWDGRSPNLEAQALVPVEDPIEMNAYWPDVVEKLKSHSEYPAMFRKAFGIESSSKITKELVAKALAQFERTILSTNSKYDKIQQEIPGYKYTDEELLGLALFIDGEPLVPDAECFHCHNLNLTSSSLYFNNGIQIAETIEEFKDPGRGGFTGNILDYGTMKVPSLRNILFSAPYMHDGRFENLDQVLEHYNSGGHHSPNINANIYKLNLNQEELDALKAFILTFQDTSFMHNPALKSPFN